MSAMSTRQRKRLLAQNKDDEDVLQAQADEAAVVGLLDDLVEDGEPELAGALFLHYADLLLSRAFFEMASPEDQADRALWTEDGGPRAYEKHLKGRWWESPRLAPVQHAWDLLTEGLEQIGMGDGDLAAAVCFDMYQRFLDRGLYEMAGPEGQSSWDERRREALMEAGGDED